MVKTAVVVVNPARVQDMTSLVAEVNGVFTDDGWPAPAWVETTADKPGRDQAARAVADGADVILVCGGDGTVRSCAAGLAGSSTAMCVVPLGTGNLLALNLHLPTDVTGAARLATRGDRTRIDLGRADGEVFTTAAGLGFDADLVADAPENLKRSVGWLAYLASAAQHLRDGSFRVTVRLDDAEPHRYRARCVIVANVGQLHGGLTLAPDARCDDGRLDIVVVSPRRPRDWPGLIYQTLRRRDHARLRRFTARTIEIAVLSGPVNREVDGDAIGAGNGIRIETEHAALDVCVP
ncbi:MAG: diacylglycerol/lipid kinase family protein [Streptosporangiales bacterium]